MLGEKNLHQKAKEQGKLKEKKKHPDSASRAGKEDRNPFKQQVKQKLKWVFPKGDGYETLETYPVTTPKYVAESPVTQPLEHSKPEEKTIKEQVAEVLALTSSLGV